MPGVCILLADGFEEIEAVTVIDVLRRADVDVTILAVQRTTVEGSHGIRVQADRTLREATTADWDMVVLPGGMPGAATLRDDAAVQSLIRAQHERGGKVAAICAAPIALARAGILESRRATCYPAFSDQLGGARFVTEQVVEDSGITTSRGPGTAMEFALRLAADLKGSEIASAVAERMLVRFPG